MTQTRTPPPPPSSTADRLPGPRHSNPPPSLCPPKTAPPTGRHPRHRGSDGLAVFARVRLRFLARLELALRDGQFANPSLVEEMTADVSQRYLDALTADEDGRRAPASWLPLLRLRSHPQVYRVQFALSGVNTLVAHDLPRAVVDTCRRRGLQPATLEGDFERFGAVLAAVEEEVREELTPGPDVLDIADPLVHLVHSWRLEGVRRGAWAAATVLWELRELPLVAEEFAHGLDTQTGTAGRYLLTPVRR